MLIFFKKNKYLVDLKQNKTKELPQVPGYE